MSVDLIPKPIEFEWDKGNIDKNFKKHGVSNQEAEEVFFDKKSVLLEDVKHSKTEERYLILGKSDQDKLLGVVFTKRNQKIRVISARVVDSKERKLYEQKA